MGKDDVAKILLKVRAVALSPSNPFTYASGIKSPIYCDNRVLMSEPGERRVIVDSFIKAISDNNLSFDVVAGTASSGIPWAAWIADRLGKPMVYIRKDVKNYGRQRRVEGKLDNRQRVLLVEDLVSTGGSCLSAVEALREEGAIVDTVIAIFTYGMKKANDEFRKMDCRLVTLSDFATLVAIAVESGYISAGQKARVLAWSRDPEKWWKG